LSCYSRIIAEEVEKEFVSRGNILFGTLRVFGKLVDRETVEGLMGFLEGVFFEAERRGFFISVNLEDNILDWLAEETVRNWNIEVKDKDTLPVREGDADAV
jgi:hypothetical protein